MNQGKYGKYIIEDPKLVDDLLYHGHEDTRGFTHPDPIYVDGDLCPEARTWLDMAWVWDLTNPREPPELHKHPFAEIVLWIGSDPDDITALGGEVTWGMGEGDDAETFILTKTTAVYVPAGLPHGPAVYNRVDRPILNVAIGLGTGEYL